jgi:hypothetical protein
MIIHELWFGDNKKDLYYEVPDIWYGDCIPDKSYGRYMKFANQVNCFFHRHARDKIRYNRTNLRQFTREEREIYEDRWKYLSEKIPNYQVPETIQLGSLDEFFEKVGFDYKNKTWTNENEWSMKIKLTKHENGGTSAGYVNPKRKMGE